MEHFYQHFYEQFLDWDRLGRGCLHVASSPVELEPPFRPFSGYHIPQPEASDDGLRHTFISRALEGLSNRTVTEEQTENEDEVQYAFEFFERGEVSEITALFPPNFEPDSGTTLALFQQVRECSEAIALEILGTESSVVFQFCCGQTDSDFLSNLLRAYFPDAVIQISAGRLDSALTRANPEFGQVIEFGLAHPFAFPLARADVDPYVAIVAALSELQKDEVAVFQVLFSPAGYPWQEGLLASVLDVEGNPHPWCQDDLVKYSVEKSRSQLFSTVVRLGVATSEYDRIWPILTDLASPFHLFTSEEGNHLVPLVCEDEEEYGLDEQWFDLLRRQSRRFGMLLTLEELHGLAHFPTASVRSPKLERNVGGTRLAPANVLDQEGLYIGINEHQGESHSIFLSRKQRIRHTHIIGSSGTGKSNLLYNMIVDDILNDQGLMVLDPHGDLVDAVMACIPDDRVDDVVVLDPSDETASIAFNILSAHSDAERTILASDLVSVFERLSTSWGDQMAILLRNGILAFLESDLPGTLSDLRQFLIDEEFREEFLQSVNNPDILFYWQKTFPQFASKSSIGAVVTRLETFLAPKPVNYVVSQERSTLDFADILDSGKILLCRLSQGMIGRENASLFGSLLIAKLQQTVMARAHQGEELRRDFWCYVDEFQNFATPSMSEILTEARKYRLGLILAHQNLAQLQKQQEVAQTILSESHVRIAFRVGDHDAKSLASGFANFEAKDIQSLDTGKALVRAGRSDHDFNVAVPLRERPPREESKTRQSLITERSRERYSTPRHIIEERRMLQLKEAAIESISEAKPASSISLSSETLSDTEPQSSSPSSELSGKGGTEHKMIQQQIREIAQSAGYFTEIEKHLGAGRSIDVAAENAERSIACEVSLSGKVEADMDSIRKCLDAGYDQVLVICSNPHRRKRIRKACPNSFSEEETQKIDVIPLSKVGTFFPKETSLLKDDQSVTRRGFRVIRKFSGASTEADKEQEAKALQTIARILQDGSD